MCSFKLDWFLQIFEQCSHWAGGAPLCWSFMCLEIVFLWMNLKHTEHWSLLASEEIIWAQKPCISSFIWYLVSEINRSCVGHCILHSCRHQNDNDWKTPCLCLKWSFILVSFLNSRPHVSTVHCTEELPSCWFLMCLLIVLLWIDFMQ